MFAAFSLQVNYANAQTLSSGQIVTNTYGANVVLLNTENFPNQVLPPFTVTTVGTLSGCSTSPQVELLRDNTEVGLVTLTNGQDSWTDNGPFGISYPSDPGYPRDRIKIWCLWMGCPYSFLTSWDQAVTTNHRGNWAAR